MGAIRGLFDEDTHYRFRRYRQGLQHRFLGSESYTTVRATAPETELRCHVRGLGDEMMARQLVAAFAEYLRRFGDPELGDVVLVAGGFMPFKPFSPGDVTLYWWYSFGPTDDSPGRFLPDFFEPNIAAEPDLMLCGSDRIRREAEQAGYDALYFPIGTYGYEPLGLARSGLGYAGSKNHKSEAKVRRLIGPYLDREEFEWVDDLGSIAELNLWYNTRLVTFGLTKEGQRQWGVVNSRVFETLASGTPLVLPEHPTLDDVLGFEYPYQVDIEGDPTTTVESILESPEATLETFAEYAEEVREAHSYVRRLRTLFAALD